MQELAATANMTCWQWQGILAMDESNGTSDKRFAAVGASETEEARPAYLELIVKTPRLGDNPSIAAVDIVASATPPYADGGNQGGQYCKVVKIAQTDTWSRLSCESLKFGENRLINGESSARLRRAPSFSRPPRKSFFCGFFISNVAAWLG
jgi:Fructose-bisphosphate aldolase class-I